MGHRIIVASEKETKIGDSLFKNYGSHKNDYPYLPYITFASAVGTNPKEIKLFFERFEDSILELAKKISKSEMKK